MENRALLVSLSLLHCSVAREPGLGPSSSLVPGQGNGCPSAGGPPYVTSCSALAHAVSSACNGTCLASGGS